MGNSTHVTAFRKRRIQYARGLLGSKCCLCGYSTFGGALDFHHIDPAEKVFIICTSKTPGSLQFFKELAKCVLLCANCHREVEAGVTEVPPDVYRYSFSEEDVKRFFSTASNYHVKPTRVCSVCGGPVPGQRVYCSPACSGLSAEHKRKIPSSVEELTSLLQEHNWNISSVARSLFVTQSGVRKALKAAGLIRRRETATAVCGFCGEEIPKGTYNKYCSRACQNRGNPSAVLFEEDLARVLQEYERSGFILRVAARQLGINYSTLKGFLVRNKVYHASITQR